MLGARVQMFSIQLGWDPGWPPERNCDVYGSPKSANGVTTDGVTTKTKSRKSITNKKNSRFGFSESDAPCRSHPESPNTHNYQRHKEVTSESQPDETTSPWAYTISIDRPIA